ncbi:bifunctional metallophosphatase/5'-nucleotidase [Kribbella albertanoniae]|uniref:Bifunctional metallophosphatase/5'-nucleotidase n=1 Tax=Kribbella albertanoniae TaxID=1266829 RepID=A0A4R4PS78_9ACTN|nr:bifunctional metallophosphatase/5'-nucleotidase [Kribbella albertanoniae]TDC25200.1 bifunctional metallophosphatase/5'-nucleotidase [Kribbella albertanoniae]
MRRMPRLLATVVVIGVGLGGGTAAAGGAGSEPQPVPVQLVSITDFHGYLRPPSVADGGTIAGPDGKAQVVGGAAYLATHLKTIRAGHRNSIMFADGDSFAGWPFEVDAHADEPTIETLNALGVEFSSVGNHELDVSKSFLVDHMAKGKCFGTPGVDSCFTDSTGRRFHGADFDFQTANIVDQKGRPIVAPYTIRWVRDHGRSYPVGFIGLTVPDAPVGSTSYQPDLKALDPVESTNRAAAELTRRGVKAIVLNMHEGGTDASATYNNCVNPTGPAIELARRVTPQIDAIVTGHWHSAFNCSIPDPAGNPRPVVEAANHGRLFNEINLQLDPRTGEVLRDRTTSTNHAVTRDVTPDPQLQKIVDYWSAAGDRKYAEPVATVTGDFTRTPNAVGESTMADLAADVHLWTARKKGPADLGLIAAKPAIGSTALRGDLLVANSNKPGDADGRVLLGESWDAYGYGNPVLTVSLTGADLDTVLEQQWQTQPNGTVKFAPLALSKNVKYSFDASRAVGDRVDPKDVLIDGASLDPAKTYRVAALAYTVIGADGYTAFKANYTDPVRNDTDHETFASYLRAHKTLTPAPLDRVAQKG